TIALSTVVLVSDLTCNPTTLGQNASTSCTVTLSQAAPAGGITVTLGNSNTTLSVPKSVAVASGATSANFTATTASISSNQSATITATYNRTSKTATITLTASTVVSGLACNPN